MTSQISDLFQYQGEEFDVAGISDGELFQPELVGLNPLMSSTACYRGYQATYALEASRLVLHTLRANLVEGERKAMRPILGPCIHGVSPTQTRQDRSFNNLYENLQLPIDFTGGILLATNFIRNLYVHMGFHPAWKYERVLELTFKDGLAQCSSDKSNDMKEFRNSIANRVKTDRMSKPTEEEIGAFVERSFSRRYRGLGA